MPDRRFHVDGSPRLAFLRGAEDVDAICAMFPGLVAIPHSLFQHEGRSIAGIGCGLLLIIFCVFPGVLFAIAQIPIGELGKAALGFVFAGCGVFFAWLAATGWRTTFLVLDQDGFVVEWNGRVYQRCRWVDVSDFRLAGVLRPPRVRFRNRASSARVRVIFGLGEDWLFF